MNNGENQIQNERKQTYKKLSESQKQNEAKAKVQALHYKNNNNQN